MSDSLQRALIAKWRRQDYWDEDLAPAFLRCAADLEAVLNAQPVLMDEKQLATFIRLSIISHKVLVEDGIDRDLPEYLARAMRLRVLSPQPVEAPTPPKESAT